MSDRLEDEILVI